MTHSQLEQLPLLVDHLTFNCSIMTYATTLYVQTINMVEWEAQGITGTGCWPAE